MIQRRYCCEKLDAHHCVKSFGGFSLKQDKQVSFIAEKLYTFLRITVSAAQIKPYINMDIYYKPFSTFFIWHGQKRFCLSKKHHHLSLSDKVMFYTQMKLKKIRLALRKKECFRKTTNLKVFCHCYVWWTFVGPT